MAKTVFLNRTNHNSKQMIVFSPSVPVSNIAKARPTPEVTAPSMIPNATNPLIRCHMFTKRFSYTPIMPPRKPAKTIANCLTCKPAPPPPIPRETCTNAKHQLSTLALSVNIQSKQENLFELAGDLPEDWALACRASRERRRRRPRTRRTRPRRS